MRTHLPHYTHSYIYGEREDKEGKEFRPVIVSTCTPTRGMLVFVLAPPAHSAWQILLPSILLCVTNSTECQKYWSPGEEHRTQRQRHCAARGAFAHARLHASVRVCWLCNCYRHKYISSSVSFNFPLGCNDILAEICYKVPGLVCLLLFIFFPLSFVLFTSILAHIPRCSSACCWRSGVLPFFSTFLHIGTYCRHVPSMFNWLLLILE